VTSFQEISVLLFVTFVEKLNSPESTQILPIVEKPMRKSTKMFQKLQILQDLSSDRIRHGLEPCAHATLRS
jgi:hypothetical protein